MIRSGAFRVSIGRTKGVCDGEFLPCGPRCAEISAADRSGDDRRFEGDHSNVHAVPGDTRRRSDRRSKLGIPVVSPRIIPDMIHATLSPKHRRDSFGHTLVDATADRQAMIRFCHPRSRRKKRFSCDARTRIVGIFASTLHRGRPSKRADRRRMILRLAHRSHPQVANDRRFSPLSLLGGSIKPRCAMRLRQKRENAIDTWISSAARRAAQGVRSRGRTLPPTGMGSSLALSHRSQGQGFGRTRKKP